MLERPLTLRSGLTLPNRLVKAAMSEGLATPDGRSTPGLERLYGRFARGGVGLLLTGNVMVDRRWLERPGNITVEGPEDLQGLSRLAAVAKAHGGAAIAQVGHPGRQTNRFVSASPVAPSDGPAVDVLHSFARPRALTSAEVVDCVHRFGVTASVLERAGFDGIQVHAAHGYLVSQFLSPLTNRRADEWGGDLEGRARFLIEIVREVRRQVSPRFSVSVKLNSADFQRGGFDGSDARAVAAMLDGEGIDFLEISGGTYEAPALFGEGLAPSTREREAYFLEFARTVRAAVQTPIIVTGGFRSHLAMKRALEDGACDLIGLARPLAIEPDLPRRLLADSAAVAAVPPLPGLRALLAMREAAFYSAQLRRMAAGREPDLRISVTRAMARYVAGDVVRALTRPTHRRAPPPGS